MVSVLSDAFSLMSDSLTECLTKRSHQGLSGRSGVGVGRQLSTSTIAAAGRPCCCKTSRTSTSYFWQA